MGKVIIFSAPSGSGKTTIVRRLLARYPQLEFSISATSRAPRGEERDGTDYYFLPQEEFMRAVAENRFVEWEEVYEGTCYGTLRSEVERIWQRGHVIVFDVDVLGGINLKRIFGGDACSVFITPPRRARHGRPRSDRAARGEGRVRADQGPGVRPHRAERPSRGGRGAHLRDSRRIYRTGRMKRMMLYFGSFNPVHKGHTALAEYVLERGLCDEVALVVSPRSPYKETAELAPELDRFEMAEIACAASEYPDRIKPSAVEFLLPKPSYTIDTLRYLTQNFGSEMRFSILMGGDQIARLDGWKEYERVLEYPIYVYPRRGERTDRFAGRITVLDDAPMQDLSATQIRERIGRGEAVDGLLDDGVAEYIRRKGLWSPASRIAALSARIDAGTADAALYVERGRLHFRLNEWGAALNDFNRALALDTDNAEARQYVEMAREILEFRYKDLYNP